MWIEREKKEWYLLNTRERGANGTWILGNRGKGRPAEIGTRSDVALNDNHLTQSYSADYTLGVSNSYQSLGRKTSF